MQAKLILILLINQIYLSFLPIKDFFIKPMFENNKFMEYFIKWITVPTYAIAYVTSIIAIYFFAIAIINKQNGNITHKIKTKNKIGTILFLVSITSTAVATVLLSIFK